MRVPDEFAKEDDAEVVVRVHTAVLGKLEAARKLTDLPLKSAASRKQQN